MNKKIILSPDMCTIKNNGTILIPAEYKSNLRKGEPYELIIPQQINNIQVTGISPRFLSNDDKVISVYLPTTVKYIGYGAFQNCTNLSNINGYDNVISFRNHVFDSCKSLECIDFSCVKANILPAYIFANCDNLYHIDISKNIKVIQEGAFQNCINMKNICLPKSVNSLSVQSFIGCKNLKIEYEGNFENMNHILKKSAQINFKQDNISIIASENIYSLLEKINYLNFPIFSFLNNTDTDKKFINEILKKINSNSDLNDKIELLTLYANIERDINNYKKKLKQNLIENER